MIIFDKFSGKPRGFGFVTFSDTASIDRVMRDKYVHYIRGKWIDCKVATPCTKKSDGEAEIKIMNSPGTQPAQIPIIVEQIDYSPDLENPSYDYV
jgi:RNA recognition motif-containing protein